MNNWINILNCHTIRKKTISWPATMWRPDILTVRVVRPSVCHMRISPKLCEMKLWLLENSNRKPGFPIQNLPSDSRSETRFRHFGRFGSTLRPKTAELYVRSHTRNRFWIEKTGINGRPHCTVAVALSRMKTSLWYPTCDMNYRSLAFVTCQQWQPLNNITPPLALIVTVNLTELQLSR